MAVAVTFQKRVPPGATRGTLAELMARQKAAADAQSSAHTIETPTIMQGLGKLGMIGANVWNERKNAKAESASRDELAKIKLGVGAEGATNEQLAQMGLISPEDEQIMREERLAIAKQLADQQSVERYGPVISGEQAKALGLDATKAYQLNQATGQYDQVGGGGINIDTGEKLNQNQSGDLGFYTRGGMANVDLDNLELELTSIQGSLADRWGGSVGNFFKDPEYQRAERAAKEFLAVILRKDSGGAVTPEEMETYGGFYLPLPGDQPAVIADKRRARANALKTLGYSVEGTAPDLYTRATADIDAYRQSTQQPAAPADPAAPDAAAPADPAVPEEAPEDTGLPYIPKPAGYTGLWPADAEEWSYLDPEDQKLLMDEAARDAAARRPKPRVVLP